MAPIGREEFEQRLRAKKDLETRDIKLIMLAYRLSKYGHRGQKRDNGERYFEHPKRVALILMEECGIFTPAMLIAGLLHDIKEDSFILTWDDIELIFGKEIMGVIKTLTKDHDGYFMQIDGASQDVRRIKLSDRLDNVRDLNGCSEEKRKKYLEETVSLYLPLAEKTDEHLYRLIKNGCERHKKEPL